VTIDATKTFGACRAGYDSLADYDMLAQQVKSIVGGPTAKPQYELRDAVRLGSS
jgi:hypothetical protein